MKGITTLVIRNNGTQIIIIQVNRFHIGKKVTSLEGRHLFYYALKNLSKLIDIISQNDYFFIVLVTLTLTVVSITPHL